MSRALLCLLLLLVTLWTGCKGDAPGLIVFEGKIPKHLKLTGGASSSAKRDSVFCKGFLLQNPTAKSVDSPDLVFTRLPNGRYRAVIDLSDLPFGGFCEWSVGLVGIGIEDIADKYKHSSAVRLVSADNAHPDAVFFRPDLAVMCRPAAGDIHYMDCEPTLEFITTLKGDLHLSLDISYSHIPWPIPPDVGDEIPSE